MMARSLRAGHAFTSAFEVVATEMPEPAAVEFARAFESQRLGLPGRAGHRPDDGALSREPGPQDLRGVCASSRRRPEATSRRSWAGSPRRSARGTASTASCARSRRKGAHRALVLGALPILMLLLLQVLNPTYMGQLFSDPIGHMILLFAVLSWLLGVAWLYRLTKVDLLGGGVRFDPLAFGIAILAIGGLAGIIAAAAWRSRGAAVRRWRTGSAEPAAADPFASIFAPLMQPQAPAKTWIARLLDPLTRIARPVGEEAARLQLRLEQAGFRSASRRLAAPRREARASRSACSRLFLFVNARRIGARRARASWSPSWPSRSGSTCRTSG